LAFLLGWRRWQVYLQFPPVRTWCHIIQCLLLDV
jgi:hypothetical protein